MRNNPRSTFVCVDPIEILARLVALKDIRVVRYERLGPRVELMIEQVVDEIFWLFAYLRGASA